MLFQFENLLTKLTNLQNCTRAGTNKFQYTSIEPNRCFLALFIKKILKDKVRTAILVFAKIMTTKRLEPTNFIFTGFKKKVYKVSKSDKRRFYCSIFLGICDPFFYGASNVQVSE